MIIITAYSAQDLMKAIDYASSQRAGGCSSSLYNFDPSTGMLRFITSCAGGKGAHIQEVVLADWDMLKNEETEQAEEDIANTQSVQQIPRTWEELKASHPDILQSYVKLKCDCKSFQYQGPHYFLDQLDSAIEPENRYPYVRDPDLSRSLCKHLISVFRQHFGA